MKVSDMFELIVNNQLMKIVKNKIKSSYSFCAALFEDPFSNIRQKTSAQGKAGSSPTLLQEVSRLSKALDLEKPGGVRLLHPTMEDVIKGSFTLPEAKQKDFHTWNTMPEGC